jgi:hypothetical protein
VQRAPPDRGDDGDAHAVRRARAVTDATDVALLVAVVFVVVALGLGAVYGPFLWSDWRAGRRERARYGKALPIHLRRPIELLEQMAATQRDEAAIAVGVASAIEASQPPYSRRALQFLTQLRHAIEQRPRPGDPLQPLRATPEALHDVAMAHHEEYRQAAVQTERLIADLVADRMGWADEEALERLTGVELAERFERRSGENKAAQEGQHAADAARDAGLTRSIARVFDRPQQQRPTDTAGD